MIRLQEVWLWAAILTLLALRTILVSIGCTFKAGSTQMNTPLREAAVAYPKSGGRIIVPSCKTKCAFKTCASPLKLASRAFPANLCASISFPAAPVDNHYCASQTSMTAGRANAGILISWLFKCDIVMSHQSWNLSSWQALPLPPLSSQHPVLKQSLQALVFWE